MRLQINTVALVNALLRLLANFGSAVTETQIDARLGTKIGARVLGEMATKTRASCTRIKKHAAITSIMDSFLTTEMSLPFLSSMILLSLSGISSSRPLAVPLRCSSTFKRLFTNSFYLKLVNQYGSKCDSEI